MKKNMKGCVEQPIAGSAELLVGMDQPSRIESYGMTPDAIHKKSAKYAGVWQFGKTTSVRLNPTGDLSEYRYLTFSVFAEHAAGGSFALFLDCTQDGSEGYECVLSIPRDGWNSYRVELDFLRTVGTPSGRAGTEAIVFDCVRGGQINHAESTLYVDALFGWKGEAPALYTTMPELKGAAVFSLGGTYAIVDRKRIATAPDASAPTPFERDGSLWLPMAPVAAGLAHATVVDNRAWTLNFTYRRKKYEFCALSDQMLVNGERVPLGFMPIAVQGSLFFPLDFVKSFFHWRQVFIDPMGLVVLSNRKSVFDSTRDEALIWQLIADTTCVRPNGDRIVNDLRRQFPNPTRGKLLASFDDLMQLRRLAKSDVALGGYVSALKNAYGRTSPAFEAPAALADAEASQLKAAADALIAFAMLYRVTGDKLYAERTAVQAEAIAELSDWTLGSSLLFGEISFSMALAYDWCRHVWSEGRKAKLERAMLRVALRPMLDSYEGKGKMWRAGGVHAAVLNAGALALSLSLSDIYPQTTYRLLEKILKNAEACFAALAPDGGHAVSPVAWAHTARSLGLAVAMLKKACGTDYGLGSLPGFAATAHFPIYLESANGAWNYHACAADPIDTSMQYFFAAFTENSVLAWLRRQEILSGKKAVHPFDILFYRPIDDAMIPHLPLDRVYRKAGLALIRSGWSGDAALLGLHGGTNRIAGADLDAGSVLLEMGGERFFGDTGGDASLPTLLRRSAEGQNTWTATDLPTGAPDQNPDADVRIVEMRTAESCAYAVADMTTTCDAVIRAKRGVMLTDQRRVAVIRDEIVFAEPTDLVWRVWTRAEVKIASGRSAILEQNGRRMGCRLCGVLARFELQPYEGSDWKCLSVRVVGKEKVNMAVVCRLLEDGERLSDLSYEIQPIAKWGE